MATARVHSFRYEVAFSDTDASGRVHFSNTLRFAEQAEHDFLKHLGIIVFTPGGSGWPRVKLVCDYMFPLRAFEPIMVKIHLAHLGRRSLRWNFEILNSQGILAVSGEMVTVKANAQGQLIDLSEGERNTLEAIL